MKKIIIPILVLLLIVVGVVTFLFVQKIIEDNANALEAAERKDKEDEEAEDQSDKQKETEVSTTSALELDVPQIDMALVEAFDTYVEGQSFDFLNASGQTESLVVTEANLVRFKFIEMTQPEKERIVASYAVVIQNNTNIIEGTIVAHFDFQNNAWAFTELVSESPLTSMDATAFLASQTDVYALNIATAEASSVRAPLAPNAYEPTNVYDRDLKTAWVEGASDDGVGEYVRVYLDGTHKASFIKIHNGYHKNQFLYEENHRPASIQISGGNGESMTYTFTDEMKENIIYLGEWTTDYIQINILSTFPGDDLMDTCITEIAVFGQR